MSKRRPSFMDGKKLTGRRVNTFGFVLTFIVTFFTVTGNSFGASFNFNIPTQNADQAFREFAKQTDYNVIYSIEDLGNPKTQIVTGTYSAEKALEIMLEGTGLFFKQTGEKTIVIKKYAATMAPKANAQSIEQAEEKASEKDAQKKKAHEEGAYNDGFLLEEMIVTASKRPRRLQSLPMAINVLTGTNMEESGIKNMKDAADRIAGFTMWAGDTPNSTQVAARGITTLNEGFEKSSAVGFYMDEVPISLFDMPAIAMWDVERIEFLRGPQGTLFGEGSMAGTVRIITEKPNTTEYSARIAGEVSTTRLSGDTSYTTKGMVNVPLVENEVGMRAVVAYTQEAGWIDFPSLGEKDTNDFDSFDGRLALRWTPNDLLTVDATAQHQNADAGNSSFTTSRGEFDPDAHTHPGTPPGTIRVKSLRPNETNYNIFNLTVNYDFGFASLVSATSHFKREGERDFDGSDIYTGLDIGGGTLLGEMVTDLTFNSLIDDTDTIWSQELRLVSNGDERLDWTVGGFYRNSLREGMRTFEINIKDYLYPVNGPGIDLDEISQHELESDDKSYALFAEVDYELIEKVGIVAGLRYYNDSREFTDTMLIAGEDNYEEDPNLVGIPTTVSGNESQLSPKITLRWKPDEDMIFFLTGAHGFRSGGTNLDSITQSVWDIPESYDSESLWTYEGGVKTNVLPGLTVNAYVYYNDWTDIQLDFDTPDTIWDYAVNAGSARSYGCELELFAVLPIEGLSTNFSASYTDAEITEDVINPLNPTSILAKEGNTIPNVPEWNLNVGVEYSYLFGGSLFGRINTSYHYHSETYSDAENTEILKNDASHGVDVSIGLEDVSWGVYLFADNLFDNDAIIYQETNGTTIYSTRTRPLTIGLKFNVNF